MGVRAPVGIKGEQDPLRLQASNTGRAVRHMFTPGVDIVRIPLNAVAISPLSSPSLSLTVSPCRPSCLAELMVVYLGPSPGASARTFSATMCPSRSRIGNQQARSSGKAPPALAVALGYVEPRHLGADLDTPPVDHPLGERRTPFQGQSTILSTADLTIHQATLPQGLAMLSGASGRHGRGSQAPHRTHEPTRGASAVPGVACDDAHSRRRTKAVGRYRTSAYLDLLL